MYQQLKNYLARRRLDKKNGKARRLLDQEYYEAGRRLLGDCRYVDGHAQSHAEELKSPTRTEIINFLLAHSIGRKRYLEIGVRNPDDNYNHIVADEKYSVDPGVEFGPNPADFKVTSDVFFEMLTQGEILSTDVQFDVIFIDGLHLAHQVDRDIINSLNYIKEDGFVVLHDCNPPTEWHAREDSGFHYTPARKSWNGTTWKAFMKWRSAPSIHSCCIDSDWGVGILSKKQPIGESFMGVDPFYEFLHFSENRKELLNLISFDALKERLSRT